jgi:hypothetical protein
MVQRQHNVLTLCDLRRAGSCLIPDRTTVGIDQVRMMDRHIYAELHVQRDRHRLEGIS